MANNETAREYVQATLHMRRSDSSLVIGLQEALERALHASGRKAKIHLDRVNNEIQIFNTFDQIPKGIIEQYVEKYRATHGNVGVDITYNQNPLSADAGAEMGLRSEISRLSGEKTELEGRVSRLTDRLEEANRELHEWEGVLNDGMYLKPETLEGDDARLYAEILKSSEIPKLKSLSKDYGEIASHLTQSLKNMENFGIHFTPEEFILLGSVGIDEIPQYRKLLEINEIVKKSDLPSPKIISGIPGLEFQIKIGGKTLTEINMVINKVKEIYNIAQNASAKQKTFGSHRLVYFIVSGESKSGAYHHLLLPVESGNEKGILESQLIRHAEQTADSFSKKYRTEMTTISYSGLWSAQLRHPNPSKDFEKGYFELAQTLSDSQYTQVFSALGISLDIRSIYRQHKGRGKRGP